MFRNGILNLRIRAILNFKFLPDAVGTCRTNFSKKGWTAFRLYFIISTIPFIVSMETLPLKVYSILRKLIVFQI